VRCYAAIRTARGLVAAPAGADGDERHPVRAGDRLPCRLRVEAEKGAALDRHLLALDPPVAGAGDHDDHFLLARVGLVVLQARRAGRQLEPVDPERLEAKLTTDEPHGAARACAFDVVDVLDRVAHQPPS
jgi:hypothetical protein